MDREKRSGVTVYVDSAFIVARVGRVSGRWCHLTADDREELHTFAEQIGLRRSWFQAKPNGRWHYDVTEPRRAAAVRLGAQEVTTRDLLAIMATEGR